MRSEPRARCADVASFPMRATPGAAAARHARLDNRPMDSLAAWYPQVKLLHIALVLVSGCFFALRGAAVLAGAAWANTPAARHASVAIDSTLLAAALALLALLDLNPFAVGWLTTKLALLVVYIVLGVFALRLARTRRGRAVAYAASLAVFLYMVTVARAHHPLGLFAP